MTNPRHTRGFACIFDIFKDYNDNTSHIQGLKQFFTAISDNIAQH